MQNNIEELKSWINAGESTIIRGEGAEDIINQVYELYGDNCISMFLTDCQDVSEASARVAYVEMLRDNKTKTEGVVVVVLDDLFFSKPNF